jgi:hypothetical protein
LRPTAQDAQKARFLADRFEQLARPGGDPTTAAGAERTSAAAGVGESARPADAAETAANAVRNAERIVRLARLYAPWLRDLADRIDAMVTRGSGHRGV